MEKPAVENPRPHALAGRLTLPHPGAPGSLPEAARAPGARRALGSCTSCRQRKEFCDNGGGAEPGCRLMNNARLRLRSGRCPVYQHPAPAGGLAVQGRSPPAPALPLLSPPGYTPALRPPQPRRGAGSGRAGTEGLARAQGVCTPP